ncbi:DUF2935 family protein [Natranaerovirga pectinivora]|uniref:DUF2935 family protein n=1 Tax=Natranaerovirga pectinivora TaxID=682400 RepID=A0A4R3MH44_9FIRM|nr:DUF2935 domain-containing protein [Natranaerovirga pectinivora]TCT12999.1 DUF2935 family protein [Natranaerovirga pectinivora]
MFFSIYGGILPLRVLEEISFWKLQEKEHTTVILQTLEVLEPIYIQELERWHIDLAETEETANDYLRAYASPTNGRIFTLEELDPFIQHCFDQSNQFIIFLAEMINNSIVADIQRFAPIIVDHVIRESRYFVDITQKLIEGEVITFDPLDT